MAKQKNGFRKSFQFSKGEMTGLAAMLCIILALIIAPLIYDFYREHYCKPMDIDLKALQKLIIENEYKKSKPNHIRTNIENKETRYAVKLFAFDPNTIALDEWKKLGLSSRQAQVIINYRKKGGKFYKASDLRKMYVITPQKFLELEPYISIHDASNLESSYQPKIFSKKEIVVIEINGADTLKLNEIKGVGAIFARRIAKYRDRLGGFYTKEQLLEVYGLDSVKYHEIKDQVRLDLSLVKKIQINKVNFNDLKNNPYLSFKQINAIINYRVQHGNYKSINDLQKVMLLNSKVIEKLSPYLTY